MRVCSTAKGRDAVAIGEHLAVEDDAVRQMGGRRLHLREAVAPAAPRPATRRAPRRGAARVWARMPSHFHSTSHSLALAQRFHRALRAARPGRTDTAARGRCRVRLGDRSAGEERRRRRPVPHQPRGHGRRAALRRPAPAPGRRASRDAPTRNSPVMIQQHERLRPIELAPVVTHGLSLLRRVHVLQGNHALRDPARGCRSTGVTASPLIEDERHRLREVADGGVAVLEEPLRPAR